MKPSSPRPSRRRRRSPRATASRGSPAPVPGIIRQGPTRFRTARRPRPAADRSADLPGQKYCPASIGCAPRSASMKPGTATASAAAITTARLGSHAPKISRKPRTLVGCTMPEIKQARAEDQAAQQGGDDPHGSASQHVMGDRDGDDRRHHEDDGGRDGARGQPRLFRKCRDRRCSRRRAACRSRPAARPRR